jgi:chromosome segregation ATPase
MTWVHSSWSDAQSADGRGKIFGMNGGDVLEVLKEIRDEAKQTNVRLAAVEDHLASVDEHLASVDHEAKQTNVRLAAVEDHAKQTNVRLAAVEEHLVSVDEHLMSVDEHLVSVDEHLVSVDDHLASLDDETKQTNVQLASLEGRVEFLEKRTSKGFEKLGEQLADHHEKLELLERQRVESESRLSIEVTSLATTIDRFREEIVAKLQDHAMVLDHEKRIRVLETNVNDRGTR